MQNFEKKYDKFDFGSPVTQKKMSTDENWMDALSIISDGLPSVTEGCRLPVRMQQQVIMSPPHSKFLRKLNLKFKKSSLSSTQQRIQKPISELRIMN